MTAIDPFTPAPTGADPGEPARGEQPGIPNQPSRRRRAGRSRPKTLGGKVLEWVTVIAIAVIVALLVRAFVVQAYYIPSGSMEPTLMINNRVLVNRLAYDFHAVHRGDIVVFRTPPADHQTPKVNDLVKRVVGLPGETISSEPDGQVLINGKPIAETYLKPFYRTGVGAGPQIAKQVIPPGHYFVMGDNRDDSYDSRYFGTISSSLLVGRVVMKVWPPGQITFY